MSSRTITASRRITTMALIAMTAAAATLAAEPPAAPAAKRTPRPKPYKPHGVALMTDIARGEAGRAMERAQARLTAMPGDLESLYCLAVAHASLQQPTKALEYAKLAVDGGLPLERFYAGPRDLLAPLTESEAFGDFAAGHDPVSLVHGPMLGAMSDTRAKVWVRCAGEVPVQVIAATTTDMRAPVKSAEVTTARTADYTAVIELTGLSPDTTYHYRLLINGKPVAITPEPTFRTFPQRGEKASFQLIFAGGAGYTPQHERMWDTLLPHRPLAFLAMGDNVYIDRPEIPEAQRYCYYRRQSRPEYRRFVSHTPVFAIWDDHDFGKNDCIGSAGIDDIPWKIPVWNVFKENYANPAYGYGEKQPGIWYDFTIGDVHVIMLDCRYYRTHPKKPNPTMLGPVQKKWLFSALEASKASGATFTILASSVPWSPGTKGGSKDTWDGFPHERTEIFDFIQEKRIEGVFLISADRHRSDAYKNERPGAYPLYEASSSKLTNIHTHRIIGTSLFGYNATCSFGMLTIDTTAAEPQLTYDVYSIDNEKVHTLTVKRSKLSFK